MWNADPCGTVKHSYVECGSMRIRNHTIVFDATVHIILSTVIEAYIAIHGHTGLSDKTECHVFYKEEDGVSGSGNCFVQLELIFSTNMNTKCFNMVL
jgi:hypothetical protein